MKIIKYLYINALVVVSVLTPMLRAASPEALGYLPSNCELIVFTPSLAKLEATITGFTEKIGVNADHVTIDGFSNEVADSLGLDTPLPLDSSKPVCIALTSIMAANNSAVLLLPVNDAKAQLDKIPGDTLENGAKKADSSTFIAAKGNYLLIANNEYNLGTIISSQTSFAADKVILDDMLDSDITVYAGLANLMNVGKLMLPAALMNVPDFQSNPKLMQNVQNIIANITEIDKLSYSISYTPDGLIAKNNLFVTPTGQLAKILKPADKVSYTGFAGLPDGKLTSLSAASISPDIFKVVYHSIFDLICIGSIQNGNPEASEALTALSDNVDQFLDEFGNLLTETHSADYMSDIVKEKTEQQIYSISKAALTISEVKNIWTSIAQFPANPIIKVNEYTFDAGKINDCDTFSMDFTINQQLPGGKTMANDMTVYLGQPDPGMYLQAMDKDIFAEAVSLYSSDKTLKGSAIYNSALDVLPSEANFYLVIDVAPYAGLFVDGYNTQSEEMIKANPEMAMALAFTGPVINMFKGMDGKAGISVEINDGYLRSVSFCDSATIDSITTTVKSAVANFSGDNTPAQQEPVKASEF